MLKLGKVLKTSDVLTASADISEEDDYPEEFYEDAYEDVECKHDNFVLVKAKPWNNGHKSANLHS